MTPPELFDRLALIAHRARSRAESFFLHDHAAAQVHERLTEVNRRFTRPAIIGWQAERWAGAMGLDALCVPDTPVLALDPGAHDLVIHALSLHWADDPVGQLIQMRRALRPDGLMLAVLFAGETLSELRTALTTAEVQLRGGVSPRVAPMADIRALGGLLQRAGLALPVADSEPLDVSYASPLHLMRELRAMGETNALAARDRRTPPRGLFAQASAFYPTGADGRITATFELAYLTGWGPAESQPKPLRPGSAQARLADALGVPEIDPEDGKT